MKRFLVFSVAAFLLTACGGSNKKIIVMSKGPAEVNADAKTISAKDGAGQTEKEVVLSDGQSSFKISSPAGEATVDLPENGLYIINVKTDTIIGSYQKYSDPASQGTISQERLKQKLDSLQLLAEGKNVSAANRNFYILPNHSVRISDNIQSIVVGPYHQMTSAEKVDGKDPEVYRFYSIKEVRVMIEKLVVLTTPKKV
jgi:archaellum component FlaF (FlaF/FlaG flagellin family)